MRHIRLLLPFLALLLSACGVAGQAIWPSEELIGRQAAAVIPGPSLVATSQALIDTPILEDTLATAQPTVSVVRPTATQVVLQPTPTRGSARAPSKPVRIVIPDIDLDRTLLAVGL